MLNLQNIIVGVIIIAAVGWLIRKFTRKKNCCNTCGSGCEPTQTTTLKNKSTDHQKDKV